MRERSTAPRAGRAWKAPVNWPLWIGLALLALILLLA